MIRPILADLASENPVAIDRVAKNDRQNEDRSQQCELQCLSLRCSFLKGDGGWNGIWVNRSKEPHVSGKKEN